MSFLQKPDVQIYDPQSDYNDFRVKNIIMPASADQTVEIGIIGAPFDEGVTLSSGRAGARLAPRAVREALKKYGTTFNIEQEIDISNLRIADFGDVTVTTDIEETHKRIEAAVISLLIKGTLPIVVGGGHDISIGTAGALSKFSSKKIGGINIDAHFDVREIVDNKITSGTPFRKLLDSGSIRGKNFVEIGAHDNLNSKVYYNYLKSKNASIFTLSDVEEESTNIIMEKALKTAYSTTDCIFVSIDVDSVAQCFAPGVSAPDARGFNAKQIREFAFLAGASKAVKLLDIVEINPLYDVDNRTARLGASIIISFLNGYKTRRSV